MISDREVREAVREYKDGNKDASVLNVLFEVAQAYLSAEMPEEKKRIPIDKDGKLSESEVLEDYMNYGFNEALHLCRLVSVKDKMRVEELEKALEMAHILLLQTDIADEKNDCMVKIKLALANVKQGGGG